MKITADDFVMGQIAYEAYCEQSGGVSLISGAKLPCWDEQKLEIKEAWAAAALAVWHIDE